MTRPDATPHIAAVLAAQGHAGQPDAGFRAVDAALAATTGHLLFTILVHHVALKQSERFYSNMPQQYPVGGRKPVTDSAWMRSVMFEGVAYIGRTRDDIKEVFYDDDLIWSLGCESVLNMPVRWNGQTYGTLNLLHRAGWYDEADITNVRLFAQLALPGILKIQGVAE